MSVHVYVTGTDTGIGKTHVACRLIASLRACGLVTLGMKPVASGCAVTPAGLRNEDALALQAAASFTVDYDEVNPYAFEPAIAPHIAAADAGIEIEPARIGAAYAGLAARADALVVEGVGGWAAPLGERLEQADLVRALDLDVVLVVGLRLGCIHHARLSARAIAADGCRLAGWIGNRIDPAMARVDDNLDTLRRRIDAPLLGVVGHASEDVDPALADAVRARARPRGSAQA